MSALRFPAFRRLSAGWAFSNFGDSCLYLTLAIWVKDLTGSDASAGLVFLFLGLPFLLAPSPANSPTGARVEASSSPPT